MNILDQDTDTIIEFLAQTGYSLRDTIAEYRVLKNSDRIPSRQKPLHFFNDFEMAIAEADELLNEDGDPEDSAETASSAIDAQEIMARR